MALETKKLDREQILYFNQSVTNAKTLPETLGGTATQYPIYDGSGHRRIMGYFSCAQAPAAGFPRIRFYDGAGSTASVVATFVLPPDTAQSTKNFFIDLPLLTPFFTIELTQGGVTGNVFAVAWVYPEDTQGTVAIGGSGVTLPPTYRVTFNGLAAAGGGTFLELSNPAASGRVLRTLVQLLSKPSATIRWTIRKQSAISTGGTSTSPTVTPLDSNNAATVGVVKTYTVNPTQGALVGNVWDMPSVTSGDTFIDEPGEITTLEQPIVVRAGESLAWVADVASTVGGLIEFTDSGS